MTTEELKKMWDEFSDVPVDNNDGIELEFHGFKVGTDRMEIWKWFDEQCPNGLVKDLLRGKSAVTGKRYPQCRCSRFGQSRFGPVKRTALDGVVWWVMFDYAKGEYVMWHKFKKRRLALVQLAIDFRHNRLPYEPDPGFGKKWIHERTDQEVRWLVDHRSLCGSKPEEVE